ncbi:hypothetical protein HPO96_31410 [Kribbella sandramycini]|uniref:Uncharacterized protein n=1 Tax=Kribbella sandramycini TaxID=60450 RepID=A0A7Y4L5I5_9ACTN|nr:hypothetical protein [Kribbella sandramycini]MBB6567047.1 hypothetical protein [Kribbella sandramycini]NOL44768.1 hypothetical protein [Kribbella sandramycini]
MTAYENLGKSVGRVGCLGLIGMVLCFVAALQGGPSIAGAVAPLLGNSETVARHIGFFWGLLPAPLGILLLVFGGRIHPVIRRVLGLGLILWCLSGVLLLPLGPAADFDPAARATMNQFAFSWFCAIGAIFLAMLIARKLSAKGAVITSALMFVLGYSAALFG